MPSRRLVRAFALVGGLLLSAGAAPGQEAITTAGRVGAPPPAAAESAQPLKLGARSTYDDRGPPPVSPCAALGLGPGADPDAPPPAPGQPPAEVDHGVHGEVHGGVGTHGYREGGAALCAPIGDHAVVAIAVDAARFGR